MKRQMKSQVKNQLRIIGGVHKRRQLAFANIEGLRPTPDRLRETLFNWLMWDINGATVLDLCAGSGALAFEALSRGAKSVHMIEPNLEQVKFLKQNLALLNIDNAKVYASTAQQALAKINESFDLLFLDPPYSLNLWQELSQLADEKLNENAFIYVEADRSLESLNLPKTWQQIKYAKVGIIHAGLYQKLSPSTL
ncbi:16S rRNA (guanine966-N2)-methyltransferase [Acinetobacter marinus]|uniref:Ribosomal RNA small subunit methyltransferase D n=1 Tax=Acinetobacter marinus TaxID=281375 RepID=A0A1G6H0D1_9GAMM|nr:16S rRNA (guanine966-N2)-methyltransferase [Acinetobacter marinus]